MKTEIFDRLKNLYDKSRPQEFGKLCQKFLAIAFQKAGYTCVAETERGVQGVDIGEVEKEDEKYTIEVKTTITNSIHYGQKDIEGLQYQKEKGYQPILAVLRLERFSDWIFAKADKIKPGSIYINNLRAYRLHKLEQSIQPWFDETIKEHFKDALQGGQEYLDNVLRQKGIEVRKS